MYSGAELLVFNTTGNIESGGLGNGARFVSAEHGPEGMRDSIVGLVESWNDSDSNLRVQELTERSQMIEKKYSRDHFIFGYASFLVSFFVNESSYYDLSLAHLPRR